MNFNKPKKLKTMNFREYIDYENRYFDKMFKTEDWEKYMSYRDRYISFVKKYCKWDKVRYISRKRYSSVNKIKTKYFARQAKYLPFDRNKIELYEKYQLGCCHKKRNTSFKGKIKPTSAFSHKDGTSYNPDRK